MKRFTKLLVIICFLFFFSGGCSYLHHYQKEQKEALETKKKNYAALFESLKAGQLERGILTSEIEARFGKPDQVFQSASTSGGFSVWTYEKILNQNRPEQWELIRLYFDKETLVDWKY